MTIKVGINGLGRMGKLALRNRFFSDDFDIVALNDCAGTAESVAHLLEFDSVHGRWDHDIQVLNESEISIDGRLVTWSSFSKLEDLDWDVDLVVECTGQFKTKKALQPYFDKGVKQVVVSAPMSEVGIKNIVFGINDDSVDVGEDTIVTAASCTTNALAPVVTILKESLGIKHGAITTIHDVTNTQTVIDGFHKDLRRSRSNVTSLIPTSSGSAKAIGMIFPDLKGKLNSLAVRVPIQNSSLIDCVFEVEKETSVDEVNALFKVASEGALKGILGYEERPLVSVDYVNDDRSSIIDARSTMVINKTQVKVLAWYDNEWGYVARMMDLVSSIAISSR